MSEFQTRQLKFNLSADVETGNYLDSQKWGWFTTYNRPRGSTKGQQAAYPLRELPTVLKLVSQDRRDMDWWISQAVFAKPNRRKVNLAHVGVAYVDLDYYRFPSLACLCNSEILDRVCMHSEQNGIPLPSMVIDSGKGLQIKWFHEPLPRKALPRWETLEKGLVKSFFQLGADMNARDISRVLRIINTYNQKNGAQVEVIWVNHDYDILTPARYAFNDLVEQVLPPLPEKSSKRRKASVRPFQPVSGFTINSLNWTRLCDLQKLVELREGDMGDGLREPMAFWLCTFFALRYCKEMALRPLDEWHEFRQLCLQAAPHWDTSKIRGKTSNLYRLTREAAKGSKVEFNGKFYTPLYTPKNDYLIDLFGIEPDEEKQLSTIHSEGERKRRKAERNKKRYAGDRQMKMLEKAKQAQKLKEHGLSGRRIAHEMGVSEGMVRKYLKVRTEQSL